MVEAIDGKLQEEFESDVFACGSDTSVDTLSVTSPGANHEVIGMASGEKSGGASNNEMMSLMQAMISQQASLQQVVTQQAYRMRMIEEEKAKDKRESDGRMVILIRELKDTRMDVTVTAPGFSGSSVSGVSGYASQLILRRERM